MDNDDITVIKPRPGRRSGNQTASASDQTIIKPRPRPGGASAQAAKGLAPGGDITVIKARKPQLQNLALNLKQPDENNLIKHSPLIDAASPLLSLTPQLRQIEAKIDVQALHSHVAELIRNFQLRIRSSIDDNEVRQHASYVLCALIDETVLNTPWGENSFWSQRPMLSLFHKETYGGERVFAILDEAVLSPTLNYELIELIYLALSLGFLGKLRIDPQGPVKAEQTRARAYDLLNRSRDRFEKQLSPNAQAATGIKFKLHSFLPVWLFVASLTLCAFGIYSYWLFDLNSRSDAMRAELAALVPAVEQEQLPDNQARAEAIALRRLLAPEIERNILSVDDYRTHTSIVLHAAEMFPSGSIAVDEAFFPVLDKIAKALEAIPGRIVVSGHTDSLAIRSPRFPSNWHLSLARASAVVKYMASVGALQARLLPEGRGESEPVASNDSAEGRARNRRVVIDIFHAANGYQTTDTGPLSVNKPDAMARDRL